jgi:hypothetical protein
MRYRLLLKNLVWGFLFLAQPATSQSPADESFAASLFRQGEYYRAVTEYLRLLHTSADSVARAGFVRDICLASYAGGDYDGCIRYSLQHGATLAAHPRARDEVLLLGAKSFYQAGRHGEAIETLSWSGIRRDNPIYPEMQTMLGIVFARSDDWKNAREAWDSVRDSTAWGRIAASLGTETTDAEQAGGRSPFLAGLFSTVVPGVGYAYSGKPGTGIAALLINGLLAWAIGDALRNEQYGIAATAGFLGLGWYIGNIAGSASAAREYNSACRDAYLDRALRTVGLSEFAGKE